MLHVDADILLSRFVPLMSDHYQVPRPIADTLSRGRLSITKVW